MTDKLTVHDPRGYAPKVTGKRLAPRLESLDGKTLYLVDCLFDNSEVFMYQLRDWFGEHLPSGEDPHHQAARKLGRRSGHAGEGRRRTATPPSSVSVYEAPVARRSSGWPWSWRRRASPRSPSTPTCSRGSRAPPRSPTACRRRARLSCRSPWSTAPPAELRGYIEGTDPISKRPFMQEVIEALSSPLDRRRRQGHVVRPQHPAAAAGRHRGQSAALFQDNFWTDFLPIVLPTEERVAAMLKGTSHAPDKVVARLSPTAFRESWEFTVEKVAVNAVMAGCRPEYFPVILAMAASGQTARSSSTTSFAGIGVVNGPIRNEIGMDAGIGVMGPFNHANATIGRAYNLVSVKRPGRLHARRHLHGHARQLVQLQRDLPGERGGEPVGAAAHALRLQADRQRGHGVPRRALHPGRVRPARDLEGEVQARASPLPQRASRR